MSTHAEDATFLEPKIAQNPLARIQDDYTTHRLQLLRGVFPDHCEEPDYLEYLHPPLCLDPFNVASWPSESWPQGQDQFSQSVTVQARTFYLEEMATLMTALRGTKYIATRAGVRHVNDVGAVLLKFEPLEFPATAAPLTATAATAPTHDISVPRTANYDPANPREAEVMEMLRKAMLKSGVVDTGRRAPPLYGMRYTVPELEEKTPDVKPFRPESKISRDGTPFCGWNEKTMHPQNASMIFLNYTALIDAFALYNWLSWAPTDFAYVLKQVEIAQSRHQKNFGFATWRSYHTHKREDICTMYLSQAQFIYMAEVTGCHKDFCPEDWRGAIAEFWSTALPFYTQARKIHARIIESWERNKGEVFTRNDLFRMEQRIDRQLLDRVIDWLMYEGIIVGSEQGHAHGLVYRLGPGGMCM